MSLAYCSYAYNRDIICLKLFSRRFGPSGVVSPPLAPPTQQAWTPPLLVSLV